MKKIKFTCSWCNDEELYKRFVRVYSSSYNKNPNYEFTSQNDFDYLVIINGPRYNINHDRSNKAGVIMEPSNSPTVALYQTHLQSLCNHILWHYKQESSQYIYYPGLLPYHMDYNEGENLDFYIKTEFLKTKLCSLIVSYNEANSFPGSIYNERVRFAKSILNTNLDIDIYGNNWEKSGIVDSRIKGTLNNKKDGLLPYKFSIAIENCVEPGYFSEKITDCILTDTIPIYYGCPSIKKIFPNSNVLDNLTDTLSLKQILESNVPFSTVDKKIFATKFNLFTAVIKYFDALQNQ